MAARPIGNGLLAQKMLSESRLSFTLSLSEAYDPAAHGWPPVRLCKFKFNAGLHCYLILQHVAGQLVGCLSIGCYGLGSSCSSSCSSLGSRWLWHAGPNQSRILTPPPPIHARVHPSCMPLRTRAQGDAARQAIVREAALNMTLDHPNIVSVACTRWDRSTEAVVRVRVRVRDLEGEGRGWCVEGLARAPDGCFPGSHLSPSLIPPLAGGGLLVRSPKGAHGVPGDAVGTYKPACLPVRLVD